MDVILLVTLTVGWSAGPVAPAWSAVLPNVAARRPSAPSVLQIHRAKLRCGTVRLSAEQDDAASPAPAADPAIEALVRDELAALAELEGEAQEAALPGLLQRVQERAAAERVPFEDGYKFGDVSKTVLEATRGEVTRQLDADWDMRDVSLLLRVGLFLGAGAAAPVAGLAAMPVAALLATYGAALKLELGGRAVQEVTVRVGERAAQGIADGVKSYTGKEEYQFGDLTTATVRKATGNEDYEFGDLTKGALKKMAGKGEEEEYKFGDITKRLWRRATGKDE